MATNKRLDVYFQASNQTNNFVVFFRQLSKIPDDFLHNPDPNQRHRWYRGAVMFRPVHPGLFGHLDEGEQRPKRIFAAHLHRQLPHLARLPLLLALRSRKYFRRCCVPGMQTLKEFCLETRVCLLTVGFSVCRFNLTRNSGVNLMMGNNGLEIGWELM